MRPPSQFDRVCVVLVRTRNPLNIGAVARAMSNFGLRDLRLVNPFEASFREARSAVGAAAVLAGAREYSSVAEAVADCGLVIGTTAASGRELRHPLQRLGESQTATLIRKQLRRGRMALLFGSEKRGLSNDDFSHCHWLLRIPTREEHGSMNLGQAVAVSLYELAREIQPPSRTVKASPPRRGTAAKRKNVDPVGQPAPGAALERITRLLLEALRASGYLESSPSTLADEKVRRMIRRLKLSVADAELLLGMLRQMVWKIKSPKDGS